MKEIREPRVAGMFYPSNKDELKKQINSYLDEVEGGETFENISGIISPHAGYIYSGKTAAAVFKTIVGKTYKNVIVLSPSHREYFQGISVYSGDAYKTPLGEIPINKELRDKIVSESKLIYSGMDGHREEHALEVQLPFLQIVLSNFHLVPIVIGDQSKKNIDELANVLSKYVDENTLLVASSDLSHFYSKEEASIKDNRVAEHINQFDIEELQCDFDSKRCEACGGGGIIALLKTLKKNCINKTKIIMRSDSGDITGDDLEVVGYLSAIVYN